MYPCSFIRSVRFAIRFAIIMNFTMFCSGVILWRVLTRQSFGASNFERYYSTFFKNLPEFFFGAFFGAELCRREIAPLGASTENAQQKNQVSSETYCNSRTKS